MNQPDINPNINPIKPVQEPQKTTVETAAQPQSIRVWRFWTPLALQLLLLVSVPAQSAYTYVTGRTVTLQTAPVDPYDFLRGYYQTLGYEISNRELLASLPGGQETFDQNPRRFYVVLEAPEESAETSVTWEPIRVSQNRPQDLAANQVAIQGQLNRWGQVVYGLESYYMPEDQREQLNQEIRELQQQDPQAFVVEARVDAAGNAVPVSLQVGDESYRF